MRMRQQMEARRVGWWFILKAPRHLDQGWAIDHRPRMGKQMARREALSPFSFPSASAKKVRRSLGGVHGRRSRAWGLSKSKSKSVSKSMWVVAQLGLAVAGPLRFHVLDRFAGRRPMIASTVRRSHAFASRQRHGDAVVSNRFSDGVGERASPGILLICFSKLMEGSVLRFRRRFHL